MPLTSRLTPMLTLGVLVLLPVACGGGTGDWVVPTPAAEKVGQRIRITGVIRYNELEGGFFAIRGSDDVTYDPTNLPERSARTGWRSTRRHGGGTTS